MTNAGRGTFRLAAAGIAVSFAAASCSGGDDDASESPIPDSAESTDATDDDPAFTESPASLGDDDSDGGTVDGSSDRPDDTDDTGDSDGGDGTDTDTDDSDGGDSDGSDDGSDSDGGGETGDDDGDSEQAGGAEQPGGAAPPELTPLTPAERLPALDTPEVLPIRPLSAGVVGERPGAIRYDLSPDGRWKLTHGVDGVCLATIDDAERVCDAAAGGEPVRVAWSPDSTRVVISPSLIDPEDARGLVTLSVDGDVSVVEERSDSGPPGPGDAFSAAFLDANTIVYWGFAPDFQSTEVHTMGADGSDDRLAVDFTGFGPEFSFGIDPLFAVDGLAIYATAGNQEERPLGRFDLESGTWLPLLTLRNVTPDGRPTNEAAVAVTPDVVITADTLLTSNRTVSRDLAPFHEIVAVDGSAARSIDDRPDHLAVAFAFSPAGDHVAMLSQYVGDDSAVTQSDDLMLLSIATTSSLLGGEPEWFDLTGVAPTNVSQDWDGIDTTIVWTRDDVLWLELQDRIVEVALAPAG